MCKFSTGSVCGIERERKRSFSLSPSWWCRFVFWRPKIFIKWCRGVTFLKIKMKYSAINEVLVFLCACFAREISANPLSEETIEDCELNSPGISLTPSPIQDRKLDLNDKQRMVRLQVKWWKINDWKRNDWIGVWNHDAKTKNGTPLKRIVVDSSDGSHLLDVLWSKIIKDILSDRNLSKIRSCLPLRAGYIRNGHELIFASCLRIYPFWMQKLHRNIHNKSLGSLFLPGATHETYDAPILGLKSSPWYELLNGARYLKTSVEIDENLPNRFFASWVNRKMSLVKFLNEVYYFLKQTKEIVIVEIQLSTNDIRALRELESIIMTLFYGMLITKDHGLEIGKLWKANKRLLVACPQIRSSKYIWEGIESITYTIERSKPFKMDIFGHTSVWALNIRGNHINAVNSGIDLEVHDMIDTFFIPRLMTDIWKSVNIVTLPCLICTNVVRLAVEANHKKEICPEFAKVMRLLREFEEKPTRSTLQWNTRAECNEDTANPSRIRVWPTLKAQGEYVNQQFVYRLIQVNWEVNEVSTEDLVVLFKELPEMGSVVRIPPNLLEAILDNDTLKTSNLTQWTNSILSVIRNERSARPDTNASQTPLFVARPYASQGVITTAISHHRPTTSALAKGGCVGFSVAYIRKGIIVASRCIASYPKWIWDNRSSLGNVPLRSLIIPGTHNSGSYSLSDTIDPVNVWVVCQGETVLTQLLLGARYLDLRVGYYPKSVELLWINHDLVRWLPLYDVLNDIKAFSFMSPDPIIIDIHRTPVGFDKEEASRLLVSLINSSLGEYLAPSSLGADVTPEDMWGNGQTVIVSYGSPWMRSNVPWLWSPIFQAWANAQLVEDLRRYLDQQMEAQKREKLWAAMGHLTPSLWDIILKIGTSGVRKLADNTGRPLTMWLKGRWGNKANIMTSDFIHTNDIIFTSIRLNILRSKCAKKIPQVSYTTAVPTSSTIFSLAERGPLNDYKTNLTVISFVT